MVQEIEGLARVMSLEPKSYFAKLNGQWIKVYAIDAVTNDIAYGFSKSTGAGLLLTGANGGELSSNPAGSIEKNMTRPAGNITYGNGKQGGLRIRLFELIGNDMIERMLDERMTKLIGGVVRTGRGAVVPLYKFKGDLGVCFLKSGLVLKEAFVNRTEFFYIQGGIVYPDKATSGWVLELIESTKAAK